MAVISGTSGNDTRIGSNAGDIIATGNGNDLIFALQGHDTARGDNGNDTAWGGDGRDWLYGGTGRDSLFGDAAGDRLDGGTDNDLLNGGTGDDTVWGGNGADQAWGADGDDSLYGGNGADLVGGGDGDDLLQGGAGNDSLRGAAGSDTAVFAGDRAGYAIARAGNVVTVTDLDTTDGNDGTDRLVDVEALRFADRTVELAGLDLDVLAVDALVPGEGVLAILANQGGDQAGTEGEFASLGTIADTVTFTDVALGDLDGDGDLDAVIATFGNGADSSWLVGVASDPGEESDTAPMHVGGGARAVALGDLDGDGDLDAFFAGVGELGGNVIAVNTGDADPQQRFAAAVQEDLGSATYDDLALGDFDLDGDLDVFLVGDGAFGIGFNLGEQQEGDEGTFLFDGAAIEGDGNAVALGEVSGDAFFDMVIAGGSAGTLLFVANTEDPVVLDDGNATDVAIGDLDADGDLDIVSVGPAAGPVALVNQGVAQEGEPGTFEQATLPALEDSFYAVALGDLDSDQDLDIMLGGANQAIVLVNQGGSQLGTTGSFVASSAFAVDDATLTRLALGDFDGDGSGRLTESGLPWLGEGLAYTNELGLV
ncbi:MAG: calcium-binding protein [Geminicoccaceae bacterium]